MKIISKTRDLAGPLAGILKRAAIPKKQGFVLDEFRAEESKLSQNMFRKDSKFIDFSVDISADESDALKTPWWSQELAGGLPPVDPRVLDIDLSAIEHRDIFDTLNSLAEDKSDLIVNSQYDID